MFSANNKLSDLLNRNLLENYFVAALASLTREKVNLALTVFGLAIGLAASFLIALYAINQSSYDEFQPNADQTYRLVMHAQNGNEYALSTPRARQTLKKLNSVEDVAMLMKTSWVSDDRIKIGGQHFKLRQSYSATNNITDFVGLEILHGDLITALTQPEKIALSKSEALRLFGTQDAVGLSFTSQASNNTWMVSAVFADIADNSHFAFHSLVSILPFEAIKGNIGHYYLRMAASSNDSSHIKQVEKEVTQTFADIWHWENTRYQLQPLVDIHLAKNYATDMKVGGAAKNVSISTVLSILLLLISSFNTINMSVAQAGSRAKEVGVRKALGASRLQLVIQFLAESVVLAFIGALIGAVIVELVLPQFNQLVGDQLSVGNWSGYVGQIVMITFFIGVASGLYPALFIAAFSTKKVLSGDFQRGKSAIIIRKSLMVLQSAFSIALIIGAITLSLQLHHLQNLTVNYEKQQRLMVVGTPTDKVFSGQNRSLYQALNKIEGVISATATDFDPTNTSNAGFFVETITGVESLDLNLSHGGVGFNPVQTLGLQLVAGRDFSSQHPGDWYNNQYGSSAIIIPESALSQVGYQNAEQAIGKVWVYSAGGAQHVKGTIVGVIKDIKIGSVRTTNAPLVLVCGLAIGSGALVIEVNDQHSSQLKLDITDLLTERLAMNPVEIQSVNHNYQALYQTDERLVKMVTVFCTLAVFLTCVGMFGLAAFNTQKRSREIAIRKVIGASRLSLVNLLAWESMGLVALSIVIAFPTAYYFLDDWLSHFNQRINQSVAVYLGAALMVTVITWLTVSLIALSAASARPSAVLRSE